MGSASAGSITTEYVQTRKRREPRSRDAAIAAGGNPGRIAQAQVNIAEAHVANGEFAKAILDFKKGWQNAVKAL